MCWALNESNHSGDNRASNINKQTSNVQNGRGERANRSLSPDAIERHVRFRKIKSIVGVAVASF
jgi:hypothetical protein